MIKKFIISLVLLVSVTLGFGSLSVEFSKQTPNPANPGDSVFVDILVSNYDSNSNYESSISFIDSSLFKLVEGTLGEQKIGILEDGESTNVRFRIRISEFAKIGLNIIEFNVNSNNGNTNHKFEILVNQISPKLNINKFYSKNPTPGALTTLEIEIENTNSISIKDVYLSLDLFNVEDKVINLEKTTNTFYIKSLKPHEIKVLKIPILISPQATSKPYLIPLKINYKDILNNKYELSSFGNVNIKSKPELIFEYLNQENGNYEFALANPTTSTIKSVQIKVLKNDKYEILEGKYQYIGDLNSDDFQIISSKIKFNKTKNNSINFEIIYKNSYNLQKSIKKTIFVPFIKIETKSNNKTTIIIILIVIGGIYYFYKKKDTKKNKK
jgi:hypothetical protein